MADITNVRADAMDGARRAEIAVDEVIQMLATASLNTLRVAVPEAVVQAAQRLNPNDIKNTINDLWWAVADDIEDEDGDDTQTERYARLPAPGQVVTTRDDLALKNALLAWVRDASLLTLKLCLPCILVDVASRCAQGYDPLDAFESYIWDDVQGVACARLGIASKEW